MQNGTHNVTFLTLVAEVQCSRNAIMQRFPLKQIILDTKSENTYF